MTEMKRLCTSTFAVSFWLLSTFTFHECVEIDLGNSTILKSGQPFRFICRTSTLSRAIIFYNDGSERGTCLRLRSFVECRSAYNGHSIYQNTSTKETILDVQKLDINQDIGSWTCAHGNVLAPTKTLEIYDYDNFTFKRKEEMNKERRELLHGGMVIIRVCVSPIPSMVFVCKQNMHACRSIQNNNYGLQGCARGLQMYQVTCIVMPECEEESINVSMSMKNTVIHTEVVQRRQSSITTLSTVLNHTINTKTNAIQELFPAAVVDKRQDSTVMDNRSSSQSLRPCGQFIFLFISTFCLCVRY